MIECILRLVTVSGPRDTAVNKTKGKPQPFCNYRKKKKKNKENGMSVGVSLLR